MTRNRTEVGLLAACGLFACAHQDQAPVHPPVAEIAPVRFVEPVSLSVEPVSPNLQEQESKPAVLDQLKRWARSNIRLAFSSRPYRSDICFSSSVQEVPCSNPMAARQDTKVWDEITVTVVNGSDVSLTCEGTGRTKDTAILPPKATKSFSILTMPRAVDAEREVVSVRCSMLAAEAVDMGALPADTSKKSVGIEVRYGGDAEIVSRTVSSLKRREMPTMQNGKEQR